MKYKVKYLVDDPSIYFLKCINIDNYEMNEEYEIEVEFNQTMILNYFYVDRFCKVIWRSKKYFGLSEEDYKYYINTNIVESEYQLNMNNVRTVKDLIISEIVE